LGRRLGGKLTNVSSNPSVIDVTDDTFATAVLEASKERPVVVDFWAAWCGPCRALSPTIEEAVTNHGGVTLAKLDVDANPRTAAAFGISGIPAVKAFRDGRVVSEFLGLQPKHRVEEFLASLAPPGQAVELPTDEAGLRTALVEHPESVEARRALGVLLLEAGKLDDADGVLAPAAGDPVVDGLRARIELLREGAPPAFLTPNGHDAAKLPEVIAAIRTSAEPAKSRLRRVAVGIIEAERARDPRVEAYRAELASALF
jgi:putative thioredoxin